MSNEPEFDRPSPERSEGTVPTPHDAPSPAGPLPDWVPAESDGNTAAADPAAGTAPVTATAPRAPLATRKRLLVGAAVAVGIAATGGVAVAATHDGGSSATAGGQYGHEGMGGPGGFGGRGGMAGGLADALHGTFVATAPSGTGTVTETLQTGAVTAVSGTSLAVKSTDGYTQTYTITGTTTVGRSQTISQVKVGDTVTVVAQDNAATSVQDRSLQAAPGGTGRSGGRGPGNDGPGTGTTSGAAGTPGATAGTT